MSPEPVSAPVLISEQPDRVRRSTASPPWRHVNSVGGVEHPMTPAWKC